MSVRFLAGIVIAIGLVGCSSAPAPQVKTVQTTTYKSSQGFAYLILERDVSFKESKPGCYRRIEAWTVTDTRFADQALEDWREGKSGTSTTFTGHGSSAAAAINDYLSRYENKLSPTVSFQQ